MLGDQIYVAALVEQAGKTPVGELWGLDRSKVMIDLGMTDGGFDDFQRQIEARMPGKWEKASGSSSKLYLYMRLA